jgi:hypothetical protein
MVLNFWRQWVKDKEAKLLDSEDIAKIFKCSDLEIDHVLEECGFQEDIGGYWEYNGENSRYFAAYVPTKRKGFDHCALLKITGYGSKHDQVSFKPLWRSTILNILKKYI